MENITVSKIHAFEGEKTIAYLTINHERETISLIAPGKKLEFNTAINILMANTRVVGMINNYFRKLPQERRKHPFAVWTRYGMSGCMDIWVQLFQKVGNTYTPYKRGGSIHRSCAWKLNEDLREIYIGDLAEILLFLEEGKTSYSYEEYRGDIHWTEQVLLRAAKREGHCYVPYRHEKIFRRGIYDPSVYDCRRCDTDAT